VLKRAGFHDIRNVAEYSNTLSIMLIHSSRSSIAGSIDSAHRNPGRGQHNTSGSRGVA